MSKIIKKITIVIISVLIFFLLLYLSNRYSTEDIIDYIEGAGIYAPLIYIIIQIAGQIFAPLSTSVLFVAGFILFGKKAIVYMIVIWMITSITNFLIARRYGKSVLKFFIGDNGIKTVEDIVRSFDNKKYLAIRLLTFYMNDFASYAFGLTNIKFVNYIVVTIISIVPWSAIMILVMQGNNNILTTTIKVFSVMIPFSLISYIFFKKISLSTLYQNVLFRLQNRGK